MHVAQVARATHRVVLCGAAAEAASALELVLAWLEENELALHPEKTRIVDASQAGGFDFLGYHFERGRRWTTRKSVSKLRAAIRVKTKRANGHSLRCITESVNVTLRDWFEYFKHSHWTSFTRHDQWNPFTGRR